MIKEFIHINSIIFEKNNVHSIFECEEQANLVVTQLDSAISELDLIDDLLSDYAKKLDVCKNSDL